MVAADFAALGLVVWTEALDPAVAAVAPLESVAPAAGVGERAVAGAVAQIEPGPPAGPVTQTEKPTPPAAEPAFRTKTTFRSHLSVAQAGLAFQAEAAVAAI